jgi:hypothetical protein
VHDVAYEIGRLFFETYVRPGDSILDVGSSDVNGSLRDFEPKGSFYIGVDLEADKGWMSSSLKFLTNLLLLNRST